MGVNKIEPLCGNQPFFGFIIYLLVISEKKQCDSSGFDKTKLITVSISVNGR